MTTGNDIEAAFCTLHNAGATLTGNTQQSDLDWLARLLFDCSRLGVGDVRTIPWLLGPEDWRVLGLGLVPQALMGNGPHCWDMLTAEQQEAWRKLARICWYALPAFAYRVGHRFLEQAKALRVVWREKEPPTVGGE